jgi:hypothetical protein
LEIVMAEPEKDDDSLQINPEKVCFIILKSRELLAEDEGIAADASNATDGGARVTLTEDAYRANRRELAGFISALDEDEACELVALVWVGRGDFDVNEWKDAVELARAQRETPTAHYLLGMPLLPDYLEEGLEAFGESCGGYEMDRQ